MIAALVVVALLALGTWQVRRLAWKRDLIARVQSRIDAPPTPAPGPSTWPGVTTETAAYRHIRLSGRYLHDRSVRTQAATALGGGSWFMTPMATDRGFTVLVNRGFVPPGWRESSPPPGPTVVTGLLRITEPGGGFLRRNDPAAGRWYSRDVAAIAADRRLTRVAPYFVDAAADRVAPARPPVGGLTIVAFPNNHLVYAITWYGLALMVAGGWMLVLRYERRLPR
nr:SURF1 family protein [Sphingomonas montana]